MSVEIGSRAIVHVNLHKRVFSVLDAKTHLVIAHVDDIALRDLQFRIRPACLKGIQDRGTRAVCAHAVGFVTSVNSGQAPSGTKVTFNPFRSDYFHLAKTGERIDAASAALFSGLKVWVPQGALMTIPQLTA